MKQSSLDEAINLATVVAAGAADPIVFDEEVGVGGIPDENRMLRVIVGAKAAATVAPRWKAKDRAKAKASRKASAANRRRR